MPFSLWLGKRDSYSTVAATDDTSEQAVSAGVLDDMLSAYRANLYKTGCWLVPHPEGDPWCCVWNRASKVELAVSFGSPNFLRNVADAFDLGLRLAEASELNLFEGIGGRRIVPSIVDELLDEDAPYAEHVADYWLRTRRELHSEMMAPLEYPILGDSVSEFFAFLIRYPGGRRGMSELGLEGLPGLTSHVSLEALVLEDKHSEEGVVQVLQAPDEEVLMVRPYWSALPFADLARATLNTAKFLGRELGAEVIHNGRQLDAEWEAEVRTHSERFAVDYFVWLTTS
jgi:hypothetical protein